MLTDSTGIVVSLPNRGKRVNRIVQGATITSYPVVMWFGYAVLRFPPSLVGFTIVWIAMLLYWEYIPYEPLGVAFDAEGLTAKYRKGQKSIRYQDIVRIEWGKDFAGGGIVVRLSNDDIVVIADIDRRLMEEILRRVGSSRPDLGWGPVSHGLMSSSWGAVSDSKHRDESLLRMHWGESFNYDYFFWGRRLKSSDGVMSHVLNIKGGSSARRHAQLRGGRKK